MGPKPLNESLDSYDMGRTSEEYQRLRQQAKVWEASTMQILQRIGLREGMSCLDVGCGPGEAMHLMGETVGELGHVTGLDVDGKLGHEMLEVLKATVKGNFSFIEGDIEAIDEAALRGAVREILGPEYVGVPGKPSDCAEAQIQDSWGGD